MFGCWFTFQLFAAPLCTLTAAKKKKKAGDSVPSNYLCVQGLKCNAIIYPHPPTLRKNEKPHTYF